MILPVTFHTFSQSTGQSRTEPPPRSDGTRRRCQTLRHARGSPVYKLPVARLLHGGPSTCMRSVILHNPLGYAPSGLRNITSRITWKTPGRRATTITWTSIIHMQYITDGVAQVVLVHRCELRECMHAGMNALVKQEHGNGQRGAYSDCCLCKLQSVSQPNIVCLKFTVQANQLFRLI